MKLESGRSQSFRANGGETWQTNSDTWKENRVSEKSDAEKIHKHSGVPQPRKSQLRIAPF
jgi:hypothetical protein